MQAVISLLPEPCNTQVEQIWDSLEDHFGLNYVRVTPIPHFTWQLGEGYQQEDVIACLHDLTLRLEPFEICTQVESLCRKITGAIHRSQQITGVA